MATSEAHRRHLERGRRIWALGARPNRANTTVAGWQQRQWTMAVAQLDLQPGQVVLDFGCGNGNALPFLRDAVGATGRVVGVDDNPAMLAAAAEVVATHGWDNVELRRADLSAEALEPATYDAAVASYVLGAVPDIENAVRVLHDSLRRGGRVFACDMAFGPHLPARLLRMFYRRVMTGNGDDVRTALSRQFDTVEPAVDDRGRPCALEAGRSWPPVTYLRAGRAP